MFDRSVTRLDLTTQSPDVSCAVAWDYGSGCAGIVAGIVMER